MLAKLTTRMAIATTMLILGASPAVHADTSSSDTQFEKDRAAILAMAGEFKVSFRFDETLTLAADAMPSKRHVSRGHETVHILHDTGESIQLQHLLVVDDGQGNQHVVKHWRQDWQYQPKQILTYRGHQTWDHEKVPRGERSGKWSQTVYQVDDSPRYAGYGAWVHVDDHSFWESNETWRPLPRREESKRDDYDVLVGVNRHSLTPEGWAHEQDNYKLALREDGDQIVAREIGLNVYTNVTDYDFTVADEYWKKTAAYWNAVRDEWASIIDSGKTIHIADEIDGEKLYARVMPLANDYDESNPEKRMHARSSFTEELNRYLND